MLFLFKSGRKEPEPNMERRNFLRWSATTVAGTTLFLQACNKDDDDDDTTTSDVNLGTGDTGVLNFAYTLEQLDSTFYELVVGDSAFNTTFTDAEERRMFTALRDHEVAHREFLKALLGSSAIPKLTFDFSSINMRDRNAVLQASKLFEDTGVSAYNGAGQLLTSPDNLAMSGKMVSLEARHAAWLRDKLQMGSFADSTAVDANGLDLVKPPTQVLTESDKFIVNKIIATGLPTS